MPVPAPAEAQSKNASEGRLLLTAVARQRGVGRRGRSIVSMETTRRAVAIDSTIGVEKQRRVTVYRASVDLRAPKNLVLRRCMTIAVDDVTTMDLDKLGDEIAKTLVAIDQATRRVL